MPEINPYANPPQEEDELEPLPETEKGLLDLARDVNKKVLAENPHLKKVSDG